MRILQSWLKRYIAFRFSPEELAEKLTMLGLEFDSIEYFGEKYRGFVVGKVVTCAKHPNADKLVVCTVDVGKEKLHIVCGAPNVTPGQKVAVGLVGATVPKSQHGPEGKPFVLSRATIRGVDSNGMICSAYELDLGKDSSGIFLLDADAKTGQELAEYLGLNDVAYDVEITPNRPDWLSHIGIAREIAVLTGRLPKLPATKLHESKEPISKFLKLRVDDRENCPRFAVRMVRGVKIGPSPEWLQNALTGAGLRPRNNVVDITNFVMLECGQPMHAFDYALLKGSEIVVRQTKGTVSFATLDGKEHKLPPGTVMVCDAQREVSIAGVMGGANSEINDNTVDVVIESAYWNPSSIRRTSKRLGINTDASQRFERGADPNGVMYALNRAAQLVVELSGGTLLKGALDVYPAKIRERIVPLRVERVNSVLGTSLSKGRITKMLGLLDFRLVHSTSSTLKYRIPTYRVDIEREIDLIEEIARVYGYNNIEEKTTATVDLAHPFGGADLADKVREVLIGFGFQEAVTNPMQELEEAQRGGSKPVAILNPLNKEMAVMRTSLVPGLLHVVARNQNVGNTNLRLFEIGHVFSIDDSSTPKLVENFLEEEKVCFLLTGHSEPRHWRSALREVDLFDLKGDIEDFLSQFALDKREFISYSTSNGLAEDMLAIEINGSYVGFFGKIREEVQVSHNIEQPVFVAELKLASLSSVRAKKHDQLPRFPKVRRDVAFVVDAGTPYEKLERTIRDSSSHLLQSLELFDVYQGGNLPAGKKSLAFSLELMSRDKTLSDVEIDTEVRNIVRKVESELGASLRALKPV
jgi:phenylalanyl-tRNA synthetase beta chain